MRAFVLFAIIAAVLFSLAYADEDKEELVREKRQFGYGGYPGYGGDYDGYGGGFERPYGGYEGGYGGYGEREGHRHHHHHHHG